MVAKQVQFSEASEPRYRSLIVMYESEEDANQLLTQLAELKISLNHVTVLRVALGSQPKPIKITLRGSSASSKVNRATFTGAGIGCCITFLIGLSLYEASFLSLSFFEAIFVHLLALVILGAVLGGTIGAIIASYQAQKQIDALPPQLADGFLVVIKTPVHLADQCVSLAHSLGAKKIIL